MAHPKIVSVRSNLKAIVDRRYLQQMLNLYYRVGRTENKISLADGTKHTAQSIWQEQKSYANAYPSLPATFNDYITMAAKYGIAICHQPLNQWSINRADLRNFCRRRRPKLGSSTDHTVSAITEFDSGVTCTPSVLADMSMSW